MSEARTQENQILAIATGLGDDKLMILSMHGTEALGRLFQYELDLFSEGSPVDYTKILGQNITLRLTLHDNETRYFNGYVSKFTLVAVDDSKDAGKKLFSYRATVVPWTWFLTRSSDCRIFQGKTVPEIIELVFRDKQMTDFENHLTGSYRKWEYCVQYRETDFNFISRLMENEGIYYYFKQENGKHTLMLCDAPTAHSPAPKCADLHFDQPDFTSGHDAFIWDWVLGQEITSNQYALTDFDPLEPRTSLLRTLNVEHTHDPATFEIFDYPGGYVTSDEGGFYANIRIEEVEAAYQVGHGTSSARAIFAGATFTLQDHPVCDALEYLITAVSYQMRNDDMGGGLGKGGSSGPLYQCEVTCIPSGYEYRTPRLTPKPIVQGPQTAIVVGKSGEEIWTDEHARVKVKFHWDRDPAKNETSSCWVRVSQPWAGKKWGVVSIPRIGQEVIVSFLEGDPDRPIITGRVYNGENTPPYELPANATMTSFKSNSSKGGGGFNEIRFEDKKDEEQVFVHAQHNYDMRVKHDRFEIVENDMHVIVKKDSFLHVENKLHEDVDSDHYERCKADHHETITGNENQDIGGDRSLKIGGNHSEDVAGSQSEHVGGKLSTKVDGDLVIESAASITIKVGGSSISIGSDGIKIVIDGKLTTDSSGPTEMSSSGAFSVSSSATMELKATGSAKLQGSAVTVKADGALDMSASGIVKVQGSMVKLN